MEFLVNLFSPVHNFNGTEQHFQKAMQKFGGDQFILAQSKEDFYQQLPQAKNVISWSFKEEDYAKSIALQRIITPAAGKDWIAPDPEQKIKTYFSTFHGPMIAESALAMLTYFNNQLDQQRMLQRGFVWNRNTCTQRRLLSSQKIVIYGHGNIGRACGKLFHALGMQVTGIKRKVSGSQSDYPIISLAQSAEALAKADHILFLIPGIGNDKIISSDFFNSLKTGASIYNFGRGNIIDEEALRQALDEDKLAYAGLDVTYTEPNPTESFLYGHPKVLLTPHNSCTYVEYLQLFEQEFLTKWENKLYN